MYFWLLDNGRKSVKRYFFVGFAAVQAMSMPVSAQDYYTPPINVVYDFASQSALTNSINQNGADEIERSNASQSNFPNSNNKKDSLHFTQPSFKPSIIVRKRNLANFVSKIRATNPSQAGKMEALFANGDIIDQMDGVMQGIGLSASNTADAYAVWWVSAWQAANGDTRDIGGATYQAVSAQAARGFAATAQFANANDAQKQEMAEAIPNNPSGLISPTPPPKHSGPASHSHSSGIPPTTLSRRVA
jgi:hypothetical protein